MFINRFSGIFVSLSVLVLSALCQAQPARAQSYPGQMQCASQFGGGNIAGQIQNSIFGGGGVVPLYQSQCLGQIGVGNNASQLQNIYGAPAGNYVLPTATGSQGLLQLGDNNWAQQLNLNLILPPGLGGINISHSEANPTIVNNNNNYNIIGR
jgi:hypothetical protein